MNHSPGRFVQSSNDVQSRDGKVPEEPGRISGTVSSTHSLPEYIVGLVPRLIKTDIFPGSKNASLIITTRKILCVKSDHLFVSHWWGYDRNEILDYFSLLHPDTIVARHPDAWVIPVHRTGSVQVCQEWNFFSLEDSCYSWRITITSIAGNSEFVTIRKPFDLLESPRVREVLGKRLRCV